MSLLNAPTDNLYKWAAIAGLSIMGMCVAVPVSLVKLVFPDALSTYDDLEIASIESKHLEILVDETIKDPKLRQRFRRIAKQTSNEKESDAGFPPELLKELPLNVRDRILGIEVRLAKLKSRGKVLELFQGAAQHLSALINVFFAGAILSLWGFVQWYRKVQSLQDRKLALETASARRGSGLPISNEARAPSRNWREVLSQLRKDLNDNRLTMRLRRRQFRGKA